MEFLRTVKQLNFTYNYKPILYGEFKTEFEVPASGKISFAVIDRKENERIADSLKRNFGVYSAITHRVAENDKVFPTITGARLGIWTESGNHPSREDIITASTFPQDFNFNGNSMEKTLFVCGMSVPPIMMKRVVKSIIDCGVFNKTE